MHTHRSKITSIFTILFVPKSIYLACEFFKVGDKYNGFIKVGDLCIGVCESETITLGFVRVDGILFFLPLYWFVRNG